jgi:hypothetical protein
MSNVKKFTGGNWVACMNDQSCWVDNGDNGLIADLEMTDIECPDELYANVSLISAAPELYNMLSDFKDFAVRQGWHHVLINDAEKLLAKARGEQ